MQNETGHPTPDAIWKALFAVSSFLYRAMEQAPERDPLRWHCQDIAVRLLRTTAHAMDNKNEQSPTASVEEKQTERYDEVHAMMRELLGVTELLRERPWMPLETLQTLQKHVWHLRDVLRRLTPEQESAEAQKKTVSTSTSQKKQPQQTTKKQTTRERTERQERIVAMLEEKDEPVASSSFFTDALSEVTARTVRRDLKALVKQGVLTQEGSGRGVRYRLRT